MKKISESSFLDI